jgi:RHS repeat-associated protein
MIGHGPQFRVHQMSAREIFTKLTASFLVFFLVFGPVPSALAQDRAPAEAPADSSQNIAAPDASVKPPADAPAAGQSASAPATPSATDQAGTQTPPIEPPASDATKAPAPDQRKLQTQALSGAPVIPLEFQIPTQPKATVDESSGALVYEYPIELPKGRNGLTPSLSLKYNSRNSAKPDSIAGLGWEVTIPYIQREPLKGTQNLYTEPYFSSSLSGNLIATTDASSSPYTVYRPESDSGDFLKYSFASSSTWTVTGKDGLTYTYGNSTSTRQDNPSDATKIYKWMLAKVADTHGNEIQYSYIKDNGQIYPSQIVYAYHASSGAIHTIDFAYTTPASNYGATVYNSAFAVKTLKLLSTITLTTTVGANTTTDTYTLNYSTPALLSQRLLTSIDRVYNFAVSAYGESFTDTTNFTYSTKAPGWEQGTYSLQGYLNYQDDSILKDIRVADFDMNGYPDLLISNNLGGGGINNHLMMNNGTSFTDAWSTWGLPNRQLSNEFAIADINGDHLPDLVPRNSTTTLINTGNGFVATTSSAWLLSTYVPTGGCGPNVGDSRSWNSNVFLYDINGDGKNDIVYFGGTSTSPDFRVFLNTGDGFAASTTYTFTADPSKSFNFNDNCTSVSPNYQALIDVNGDGLLDYVHQRYGTYLNTGSGFAYSAAYSIATDDITRTGFADINGDNLIDYVAFKQHAGSNCTEVRINNGAGFTLVNPSSTSTCTYTTTWKPSEFNYDSTNSANWGTLMDVSADGFPEILGPVTSGAATGRVRALSDGVSSWALNAWGGSDAWNPVVAPSQGIFFDINSDGVVDFITHRTAWDGTPEATSSVYMGKPAVPNRLVQITTPLGAQTVVTYGTAPTNYSDTNVAPMPVVKKITLQNVGTGQPSQVTQYAYAGGAYVIDPATGQRRFAGFHKVTATESGVDLSALRVSDTYFHQADGSDTATNEPSDTSLALIGRPYYEVVKDPAGTPKRETWTKYATSTLAAEPMTGRLATFVYPTERVVKVTETGTTTATAETYAYDTTLGERTEVQNLGFVSAGTDGTYTDISGDTRYTFTDYATNASSTIVKPSQVDLRTSPSTADTLARTNYFYDSQSLGTIGALGDLTRESKWVSGNGSTVADTARTFDTFGNVLTVTSPRNATTTYTYDSTNSHVATSTNPLGQATGYTYVTGKLTKATDPNGFATTYEYSNKGWLYRVTTQTDAGRRQRVQSLAQAPDLTWAIASTDQPITSGRNDSTWQTFDNLGRPTRLVRQETNHSNGAIDGYFLNNAKAYDALGRTIVTGAPYGASSTDWASFTSSSMPSALLATTTYDVFNRPLMTANALGTTTFTYAGAVATTTDANGKPKTTKTDAYGNLVEVDEKNGTSTYVTTYTYDSRNLLTGLTDALGNVRAFTYNNAGWLTNSEDLHTLGDASFGSSAFTYDANGNALTETEPDGTVVTRIYDALDRPTSIDGSTTGPTDYTITYDSCAKGKGRICAVSATLPNSISFVKTYAYGTSTLPTGVSLNTQGVTSTVSYQYTTGDLLKKVTYPNGIVVRYAFGDWALPSNTYLTLPGGSEANYATSTYHHTLRPATTTITNGLTVSHTYDDNKLYRETAMSATFGTSTLQSYGYTYDNTNNITRITEPGLTKDYAYDDLYRLTQAVYTPTGSASTTYAYAYNPIGNVTSANGLAYTYSGAGKTNPHAVTSIGSGTYAYDDNGNVTNTPTQTLAYNWQRQLVSVTSGSSSVVFAYDETGQRFFYQTPSTTEVQVDPNYLLRNGTPEITVKLGDVPIATIVGTTTYATIADHLNTPVKQIDAAGSAAETVSYGPFGNVLSQTGTLNVKRGYTGHEEDSDTGLVYANARYYSPATLRFYQQDPSFVYLGHQDFAGLVGTDRRQILSDPQQLNSYSYVRNNPTTEGDPTGRYGQVSLSGAVPWWSASAGLRFDRNGIDWFLSGGPGIGLESGVGLEWAPGQSLSHKTENAAYVVMEGGDVVGARLSSKIPLGSSGDKTANNGNATLGVLIGAGYGGGLESEVSGPLPFLVWGHPQIVDSQMSSIKDERINGSDYISRARAAAVNYGSGTNSAGRTNSPIGQKLTELYNAIVKLRAAITSHLSGR